MKRLAFLLVLAVAACGEPEGNRDKASETTLGNPTPPARRPGLWEQRISNGEMVQVVRICLDAAVDARLGWWGQQATKGMCEKNVYTRQTTGDWRFSSVCDMGTGGKVTTSGLATGDFNSRYVIQAESSTVGAEVPQMNGLAQLNVEAAYQGACPADMRAGDMEMPGGVRVNLMDMSGADVPAAARDDVPEAAVPNP